MGGWVEWWVCCFNEAELLNHPLEGVEEVGVVGAGSGVFCLFPSLTFPSRLVFLKLLKLKARSQIN